VVSAKRRPDFTLAQQHAARSRRYNQRSAGNFTPDVNGTLMALSVKDGSVLWQVFFKSIIPIFSNMVFC
jgi:hypothetical protein